MTVSWVNYMTATRSPGGTGIAMIMSAVLLLPYQMVLMLPVKTGSATAFGGSPIVSDLHVSEQAAASKVVNVNPWTANDILDDPAALKVSGRRLTAADIMHPHLGVGKRRGHIFVGKKNKLAELEENAVVNDDDDVLSEVVVKRPRMFVGKRLAINDEDIADGEMYVEDMQHQQDVEKRPRMFVGKRKAPVFVGKRSFDAVLQGRAP